MNILITSPYATHSLHGNTVSAMRIAGILSDAGHLATVIQAGDPLSFAADTSAAPDALIALHAKKSHTSVRAMREQYPEARIILYLTGTDLYDDIPNGCELSAESMNLADFIVVSQRASYASIPEMYQEKSAVVYNSIQLPELSEVATEPDLFTIASHLRAVKQPFLVVDALGLLDESVRVKLMGAEIDKGAAEKARELTHMEPCFEWIGEQDHLQTLEWMQRSVATINTSLAEGGANSVGESIVLGRPVLASRIEGNIGMLGPDYDGYFDASSALELATLMQRMMGDTDFRTHLENQVRIRARKYSRKNESKGWLALLEN